MGGQTIHSFFRIPPQELIEKSELKLGSTRRDLYRALDVVVIDEVSMMRSDIMDDIDFVFRISNNNDLPFGDKQVPMFGDLNQRADVPIPTDDDASGGLAIVIAPTKDAVERTNEAMLVGRC